MDLTLHIDGEKGNLTSAFLNHTAFRVEGSMQMVTLLDGDFTHDTDVPSVVTKDLSVSDHNLTCTPYSLHRLAM